MPRAKVLLINPNPRTMSLVPPIVSLFHSIFQKADVEMRYFDTTFYDVSDRYTDTDKKKQAILGVKKYDNNLPADLTPKKDRTALLADFRREAETFQPDVIMASAMESTILFAREMLESVRDLGVPHILGGVFATFAPEVAINFPEVDALCVGEGEHVIVPIVDNLKAGRPLDGLPGMWTRGKDGELIKGALAAPVNLDDNPPFTVEPYEDSRFYRAMAGKIYRMFPVESHRGCPSKCTFCNSPLQDETYKAETGMRYFRPKSVPKVLEDVRYFIETCGAEYLFFWADNFLAYSRREIDEFCEAYSDYRIPFYAQSYPTTLDDYKIKRLAEVGLDRIGMGVEHGNEEFRKNIIRRPYSNDKAIEKVGILRKYGIQYGCNNIVGFPTETPELHWDTIRLNRALQPHTASCSIFTPFFGTPLRKMSLEKGYLKDPDLLAPTNNDFSVLEMPQFPKEAIAGKSRTFNLYLKFPENRWKDIAHAEQMTPEGDRIWEELKQEYSEKYEA